MQLTKKYIEMAYNFCKLMIYFLNLRVAVAIINIKSGHWKAQLKEGGVPDNKPCAGRRLVRPPIRQTNWRQEKWNDVLNM